MESNPDYRDLLRCFNRAGARYLIVGSYALAYHARPRYTKDLDLWIETSPENAACVWAALAEFGAPVEDLTVADLSNPELVYQIGVEPNRVDILMALEGVEFDTAWRNRVESTYGGEPVTYIGRDDFIRSKEASGRPQDLLDLELLRKVRKTSP